MAKKVKDDETTKELAEGEPADAKAKKMCFTIMPFGGYVGTYYERIYKPAVEEAGLESRRADDLFRPGTITHDIYALTKEASIVLADLTGRNANVFYELGIAHALAKPVILVAGADDDVPFDLRGLRYLLYDKNDPDWGPLLRAKIVASIHEVLKAPKVAVLPAFLEVRPDADTPSVSRIEKDFLEVRRELDAIRRSMTRLVPEGINKAEQAYRSVPMPDPRTTEAMSADLARSINAHLFIGDYNEAFQQALGLFGDPHQAIEFLTMLAHRSTTPLDKDKLLEFLDSTQLAYSRYRDQESR